MKNALGEALPKLTEPTPSGARQLKTLAEQIRRIREDSTAVQPGGATASAQLAPPPLPTRQRQASPPRPPEPMVIVPTRPVEPGRSLAWPADLQPGCGYEVHRQVWTIRHSRPLCAICHPPVSAEEVR